LTPHLLDRLLARLDSDRDLAAERYNALRSRLIQYFSWQHVEGPEALADEVMNRVARRLAEVEPILSVPAYALGVARRVMLETADRRAREGRAHDEYARRTEAAEPGHDEQALACLDQCLDQLAADRREHLLAYYAGEQGGRIERRRVLAARLGIDAVALRNRMLRLRQGLGSCMERCLAGRDEFGRRATPFEGARNRTSGGDGT
jgi:DNA-directed RNA polymerase specialized sigma24 family protein